MSRASSIVGKDSRVFRKTCREKRLTCFVGLWLTRLATPRRCAELRGASAPGVHIRLSCRMSSRNPTTVHFESDACCGPYAVSRPVVVAYTMLLGPAVVGQF